VENFFCCLEKFVPSAAKFGTKALKSGGGAARVHFDSHERAAPPLRVGPKGSRSGHFAAPPPLAAAFDAGGSAYFEKLRKFLHLHIIHSSFQLSPANIGISKISAKYFSKKIRRTEHSKRLDAAIFFGSPNGKSRQAQLLVTCHLSLVT